MQEGTDKKELIDYLNRSPFNLHYSKLTDQLISRYSKQALIEVFNVVFYGEK